MNHLTPQTWLRIHLVVSLTLLILSALGFVLTPEPSTLLQALLGTVLVGSLTVAALCASKHSAITHARTSPHLFKAQVNHLITFWLIAIALISLNAIAHQHNVARDLSNLQNTTPSEHTQNLLGELPGQLEIVAFLPPDSDLKPILNAYFAPLQSPSLSFQILDQRLANQTARQLSSRDNGELIITHTQAQSSLPRQQRLHIGTSRADARHTIAQLDLNIQKQIQSLASEKRTIYFITPPQQDSQDRALSYGRAKDLLQDRLHLTVKNLPLSQLVAEPVPSDAGAIVLLAQPKHLTTSHVDHLKTFIQQGGHALLTMEPSPQDAPVQALYRSLLVETSTHPVASTSSILRMTRTQLDHYNLLTRDVRMHPAVSSFKDPSKTQPVTLATTGHLNELAAPSGQRSSFFAPLLYAPASSWEDINENYTLDQPQEHNDQRLVIAAAITTSRKIDAARLVLYADQTWMSDLVLSQNPSNATLLLDHVAWLLHDSSSPARSSASQDVMLNLLAGEDRAITWLSLLCPPLLFLILLIMSWLRDLKARKERTQ